MARPREIQSYLFAVFLIAGTIFSGIAVFVVWSDGPYPGGTLHQVSISALIVGMFALLSMCAVKIGSDTKDF